MNAEQSENHAANNDPEVSMLHSTLKFAMREEKRLQVQHETLGSKGSAELSGMLQTSKLTTDREEQKADFFKSGGGMSGLSSRVSQVQDLFHKSHISGFAGIKKKYAPRANNDEVECSYQTNFYRTQNMNLLNSNRSG